MMPSEVTVRKPTKQRTKPSKSTEIFGGTDEREKIGGFDGTVGQTNLAQREILTKTRNPNKNRRLQQDYRTA